MKNYYLTIKKMIKNWLFFKPNLDNKTDNYIQAIYISLYFLIRQIIGIQVIFIYIFCLLLIIMKLNFIRISLTFFIISLISVILLRSTEANYYLSFTFIFLSLEIIKQAYQNFFKDKQVKQ